jgi:AraC-like DNA-binding protein
MSFSDFESVPSYFSSQVSEARRFFLGGDRTTGGIVGGGGFERVRQDYLIDRPGLDFLGLEFVVAGRGKVTLSHGEFDLFAGVMFAYDAHRPHRITTDPNAPLEKYFIDLSPARGRQLMRQAQLATDRAWCAQSPADLRRLFDEILYYGASSNPSRRPICDSLMKIILLNAAPAAAPARQQLTQAFQSYQRCCRVIDQEAIELRSLKQLAERCGLDPSYLCRLFQRFDRDTAYDRLLRKRMDIAAARLYGSQASIKEIAHACGHSDPFNFSRSFKAVYGMSPSQFRQAYARDSREVAPAARARTRARPSRRASAAAGG